MPTVVSVPAKLVSPDFLLAVVLETLEHRFLAQVQTSSSSSLMWQDQVLADRTALLETILAAVPSLPWPRGGEAEWLPQTETSQGLEATLQQQAFLSAAAAPSLADVHMALLVLEKQPPSATMRRWMMATLSMWTRFAQKTPVPPAVQAFLQENNTPTALWLPQGQDPNQVASVLQQIHQNNAAATKNKPTAQKKTEKPAKKKTPKTSKAEPASAVLDISALEMRVGQITKIWPHPEAEKLYCEEIDMGSGTRQVASGLRAFYATPDLLLNQKVLVLCNLKKRNLVGFP